MRIKDLHLLPRFRDSLSSLQVEHCRVEQDGQAIALGNAQGKTPVPCASLSLLMLGPGTAITPAAVATLAANGCLALWCGEEGVRLYAQGLGLTRSAAYLLHQVRLWAHPRTRLEVVLRLYRRRFDTPVDASLTLKQLRGMEGVRVREAYARASRETGVYDVADLSKTRLAIPIAFREAAAGPLNLESRVRKACRDEFRRRLFLQTIIQDLQSLLDLEAVADSSEWERYHQDEALPGNRWDPEAPVRGGQNFGQDPPEPGSEG